MAKIKYKFKIRQRCILKDSGQKGWISKFHVWPTERYRHDPAYTVILDDFDFNYHSVNVDEENIMGLKDSISLDAAENIEKIKKFAVMGANSNRGRKKGILVSEEMANFIKKVDSLF